MCVCVCMCITLEMSLSHANSKGQLFDILICMHSTRTASNCERPQKFQSKPY